MELITKIGTILGYTSTAIALFILIKTQVLSKTDKYVARVAGKTDGEKIHNELDHRLDNLETQFTDFIERDKIFKDKMDRHITAQTDVDKKLMANIIETTYYQNRDKRSLDMNELRRITEVYAIYHSTPINGNSYISEIFDEMISKWKRLG